MLQKSRLVAFSGAVLLLVALAATVLPGRQAYATSPYEILSRSLTLQDGTNTGGSEPSAVVNHLFSFTFDTSKDNGEQIKSIQFLYCTTADGTCTTPTGLSTTSATLGTQTGMTFDSLNVGTQGAPYLTSAAGITVGTGNKTVSFQLLGVTNPSGADCPANSTSNACTFYVRVSAFTSTDASGTPTDSGNVAAAVTQQIILNGIMPESLIFCTGGSISLNAGNSPDCSTATSGSVNFNQDFSPASTAHALSQMAASTNAGTGYAITVGGKTLTSGSNTITAMGGTAGNSVQGTGQFGLNLVLNDGSPVTPYTDAPVVSGSANPNPASDGTNYFAAAASNFNSDDEFAFNDSALNTVAASNFGGTSLPTNGQIYTVSYIANVPGRQPAGTYTTTLTYICTPTF